MMTSLIGILSLVSTLTATSSALSCTKCESETSTCSGDRITCPSETMCGTAYLQGLVEGIRIQKLHRGCQPLSECGISGTISIKEGRFGIGSSCCSTDDCTPTLPTFPTKSSNPNGVICPSCAPAQSTSCDASDTVQCTGDENMCFLQTTEGLASAMRGCATKSFCDLSRQFYNNGGSSSNVKMICTNGGISAHKVVLTPAILCLLLLKLFL
ncbi:hypothetical protein GDO78_018373 [Eleutherodactylus coqui]|uniref:Phospholipase A2 inhibitor and Ly6/PLAUR domain-containing protein-like n=1 Tax=Eleutherodactylus coqui TaxID=57060 RepID=A0A8J6ECL8_ELECQ|nr:hypothetical protein GDO78_018373 [Eleutherodactylus coqui]